MSSAAVSLSPVLYIQSDVPEGMTLGEWRGSRPSGLHVSRMSGVLRRVRRVRRAHSRNEGS